LRDQTIEKIASNFVTDDPMASIINSEEVPNPTLVGCESSL